MKLPSFGICVLVFDVPSRFQRHTDCVIDVKADYSPMTYCDEELSSYNQHVCAFQCSAEVAVCFWQHHVFPVEPKSKHGIGNPFVFLLFRTYRMQPFSSWPTNRTWRAPWQQQRSPSSSRSTPSQHTPGMFKPAAPWQERGESNAPPAFSITEHDSAFTNMWRSWQKHASVYHSFCWNNSLWNTYQDASDLSLQSTCQSGLDEVARCGKLEENNGLKVLKLNQPLRHRKGRSVRIIYSVLSLWPWHLWPKLPRHVYSMTYSQCDILKKPALCVPQPRKHDNRQASKSVWWFDYILVIWRLCTEGEKVLTKC